VVALTSLHNMRCLKTFSGYKRSSQISTSPQHQYSGNSELSSRRKTVKGEIRVDLRISCPTPLFSKSEGAPHKGFLKGGLF